jgi:hypothetical protein
MSAFDPGAWLASFEAVGGWYVVNERDNITLGWRVFGVNEAAQIEARKLYNEIRHDPDRWASVHAFILDRCRGLQLAAD